MNVVDQTTACNMALSLIGTRSTIANISEQSAEAQAVNIWYNGVLQDVLRAAHWNFARKQLALSLLQALPTNQGGAIIPAQQAVPTNVPVPWTYEYAYPSDCVRIRYLIPQFQSTPGNLPGIPTAPDFVGPPVRFVVANDDQLTPGQDTEVVLTNQLAAIAVYTKLITNVAMWDPSFLTAFVHLLASRVSYQLKGDKTLTKLRFDQANDFCKEAQRTNGNEALAIQDVAPDWMRVRGYASDWAFPDGGYYFFGPQALTLIM